MARVDRFTVVTVVLLWACAAPPQPQLFMDPDGSYPDVPDLVQPESIALDVAPPDSLPEMTPVDLPDCPFKQCNPADYPDIKLEQCQRLGWNGATCDCAVFPKNEGALCDDGNQCSAQDYCTATGLCTGIGAKDCSDDNLCTSDSCDPDKGCMHTPNQQPCEDGNPCTENDHCGDGACQPGDYSPTCGECKPSADNCEQLYGDGDLCTGVLECFGNECVLNQETVVTCDLTLPPSCIENVCAPNLGECVLVPLANGTDCDDGNICTKDDYCVEGECAGFLNSELDGCKCKVDADCLPLDDNSLCNGSLHCSDGICKTNLFTIPAPCDDSADLACIKNLCVPSTGLCETTQLSDGSFCDDGNSCSLGDACQAGTCVADALVYCQDLNTECSESACDPNLGGCVMTPINEGKECPTNDPCATAGKCSDGNCLLATSIDCSDDDPCTVDTCLNGGCFHEPGGGEWALELTTNEVPVAPEGMPATPAAVAYSITNNSTLAQGLHIYLADGSGDPVEADWLSLDAGYFLVEPGGSATFHALLHPAAAGLTVGMHVAQIAVTDECAENPKTALVGVALSVIPTKAETIFAESFDSDPFANGRWAVYMGDCTNPAPGTVAFYANAIDACGDVQGYVYREYKGDRCVEYTGAPFSTASFANVKLSYAYRLVGSSIAVAVRANGLWSDQIAEAKGKDMAQWEYQEVALSGAVDGLRFFLKAGKDHLRRLDCISLEGIPACTQLPAIVEEPATATVATGATAVLQVTATGDNLAYRWFKDDAPLTEDAQLGGVHSATLTISNTTGSDAGTYYCRVTSPCGTINSAPAGLIVQ